MYVFVFFQAEDGIRDLVRSRGLGDVYKRQGDVGVGVGHAPGHQRTGIGLRLRHPAQPRHEVPPVSYTHLTLPTSDLV